MGNTSKKLAAKCTLLTREEQKDIAATFRTASKNSERIREEDLIKLWGPQMDPRLTQYLTNFLFGFGPNKQTTCTFNRFAELYVYNVRGSVDEKMEYTYASLGKVYSEDTELPYQLLREYCESIASTFIKIIKSLSSTNARRWIDKGFKGKSSHVQALGEAVAATISEKDDPTDSCTSQQLYRWLQSNTLLQAMSETVFNSLFGIQTDSRDAGTVATNALGIQTNTRDPGTVATNAPALLPTPEGIESMPSYPAFTDLSHIAWLNNHLPRKHQHKWRFLFSSHIHGESFSTLAGRIQDAGGTVVIIEDKNGYIFGGYAAESWLISPNFYGKDESFLFSLAPKMRVYPGTTFNNHYQYMNHHTKTLPNGLMMGGQFEFAGIWINADPFGHGTSAESCTTYRGFKRLSKDQDFHIRSLEVWGVGDKPLTVKESEDAEDVQVSILDKPTDAKAILELAGRTRHSEGLRDPDCM